MIMKSLLSSIAYCHERNVIHRDLKPENILIDNPSSKQFEIKVIDFGAAIFLDPGKLYEDRFGTVYYVAPEIVKGEGYNNKCDLWSMGVILFALLCGEVPFFSQKDKETLQLVMAGKYSFRCNHLSPKFLRKHLEPEVAPLQGSHQEAADLRPRPAHLLPRSFGAPLDQAEDLPGALPLASE